MAKPIVSRTIEKQTSTGTNQFHTVLQRHREIEHMFQRAAITDDIVTTFPVDRDGTVQIVNQRRTLIGGSIKRLNIFCPQTTEKILGKTAVRLWIPEWFVGQIVLLQQLPDFFRENVQFEPANGQNIAKLNALLAGTQKKLD